MYTVCHQREKSLWQTKRARIIYLKFIEFYVGIGGTVALSALQNPYNGRLAPRRTRYPLLNVYIPFSSYWFCFIGCSYFLTVNYKHIKNTY